MLALAPPEQNPAPVTTQSSITGKFSKEHLKQESLNDFLNVIPLTGEISKESLKQRVFCLSFIHWGANKAISHKSTTEIYECGYEGQTAYYENAKVYLN